MKHFLLITLVLTFFQTRAWGQWYDPGTAKTTVLLEKEKDGAIETYGTGFLLYNYENPEYPIVITCGHLLRKSKIFVTINADSSLVSLVKNEAKVPAKILPSRRLWVLEGNKIRCLVNLENKTKPTFITHPNLDIGAFLLSFPFNKLQDDSGNVKAKFANTLSIPRSGITHRKERSIGDEVYFIGFPFGIGNYDYVNPLVRSGSIAWSSNSSDIFLLDAFSYGGNSGSPIFLKRIISEPGHLKWSSTKLVGMVIGHQSLVLENILTQPNPKELKFEKGSINLNIGLAKCIWSDEIEKLAKKASRLYIE